MCAPLPLPSACTVGPPCCLRHRHPAYPPTCLPACHPSSYMVPLSIRHGRRRSTNVSLDKSSITNMGQLEQFAVRSARPPLPHSPPASLLACLASNASSTPQGTGFPTRTNSSSVGMVGHRSDRWFGLTYGECITVRSGASSTSSTVGVEQFGRVLAAASPPPPPPPPVPRAVLQPRQCVTTADGVSRCIQITEGLSLDDGRVQAMIERHFADPSP